jgi:hypothetical protein
MGCVGHAAPSEGSIEHRGNAGNLPAVAGLPHPGLPWLQIGAMLCPRPSLDIARPAMAALPTAVIYFGSFLAIGLIAKVAIGRWMNRSGVDLPDLQAMQTVVETPAYLADAEADLSASERNALSRMVAEMIENYRRQK